MMKVHFTQKTMEITPKFKSFMKDILRYRCLLTENVYQKYFDTPESWKQLHRAFVHKSMLQECMELQEFHGDVVFNLSVVEYIRENFKEITSLDWNSGLKINFVSSHFLSKTAIKYGFWEHIVFGQDKIDLFNSKQNPMEEEDFLKANEDVMEAVSGAITEILNAKTSRGIGYNACYNMIKSYLDVSVEVLFFKELFAKKDYQGMYDQLINAKTRLKETFDYKKWTDSTNSCTLSTNLVLYNISEKPIGKLKPFRRNAMSIYISDCEKAGMRPSRDILDSTKNFLVLGYTCDATGDKRSKRLIAAKDSGDKTSAEIYVSNIIIEDLKKKHIFKPATSPFKV
jgi:dsRNA-specific ribonuclease